jgi:hypothetical protein
MHKYSPILNLLGTDSNLTGTAFSGLAGQCWLESRVAELSGGLVIHARSVSGTLRQFAALQRRVRS